MQPRTRTAWGGCFFLAWEWSIWSKGRLVLLKKVAVVMGSDSDLPVLEGCFQTLKKLNIPYEAHVYSAHRTPDAAGAFAASARKKDFGVIIAAAGKAAHLAGALAARTVPVSYTHLDVYKRQRPCKAAWARPASSCPAG